MSDGSGWYFDPFAWQLMFAAGAAMTLAISTPSRLLARSRWLSSLCWAFLGFALLQSAPWTDWGVPDLRLLPMDPLDKSHLSLLQVTHSGAMIYLLFSSPAVLRLSGHRVFRRLASCGRHSREVFTVG